MARRIHLFLVVATWLMVGSAMAQDKPTGHFGAAFTDAKAVTLKDVIENVDKFSGKTIKVEGEITDVCQAKGCWLVVTDGERAMRVKFKDYGFFVPKDASGKKVTLEGVVENKTISEMHAQHLAQESKGKVDPSTIKGPQQVIMMTANGVEIK